VVFHFSQTFSFFHTHWYEIYQHEKTQQLELAKMIHAYQQENDDRDDIPMAAQQPSPASPTNHLAKVPTFGVKQLDYINHLLITNKEQKQLIKESQRFTKELIEQT
jgi:hypothetical protein